MLSATLTLFIVPEIKLIPLIILGLMGAQSALFSPAKYGILPEILPHERLSSGNALLEMWGFLAIILGTGASGALLDVLRQSYLDCGGIPILPLLSLVLSFHLESRRCLPSARKEI